MKNNKGFTLLELMAVLVIASLMLIIGTPKIMEIYNAQKRSSDAQSFISAFNMAKNHAIQNRKKTYLLSNNYQDNWDEGWLIYESGVVQATSKNDDTKIRNSKFIRNFVFDPRGRVLLNYTSFFIEESFEFCGQRQGESGIKINISGLGKVSREIITCS